MLINKYYFLFAGITFWGYVCRRTKKTNMEYNEFLERKKHSIGNSGFDANYIPEKHVHPLQLDVIDRLVELYSNPNEVVLTPFMGVGTWLVRFSNRFRNQIKNNALDSVLKFFTKKFC